MGHCIDADGREYLAVTETKRCEKGEGTAEMVMPEFKTGNQRWITGRSCQPAFAQIEFPLQVVMHAIRDSSVGPQQVQLLALPPKGLQYHAVHRQTVRLLLRFAAIRPAAVDLFQLVLKVVQQILVEVHLMFA